MQALNDILVVDDDTALVDFVIRVLREAGYLGCAAYDGESALLAIETARPALVLLDLHLPGLSGRDVVAQLNRHGLTHVPIVLMTADAAAAAQLPRAEFPEYLLKPFELTTLVECVARYMCPQRRPAAFAHRSFVHRPGQHDSLSNRGVADLASSVRVSEMHLGRLLT